MRSALICCIIGSALSFLIGMNALDLSWREVAVAILASNLGGIAALLVTSFGQRNFWVKSHLMKGPLGTWTIFLVTYFGILLGIAESIHHSKLFFWMICPLIFSAGLSIIAFGPIQDVIVSRIQRQQRLRRRS